MTQDMKKDMILHTIAKLVVPLKRTVSPLEADSHSAPGGLENSLKKVSLLHRPTKLTSPTYEVNFPGTCTYLSRITLLLFLLLTLGNNVAWGQTDYSGTYYIASGNKANYNYNTNSPSTNYYLCPTVNWLYYQTSSPYYTNTSSGTPSNDMPFLTTYQYRATEDASEAIWYIEKHPTLDYYYIKHASDGKYLTYNAAFLSNKGRVRFHLEKSLPSDVDYALFAITYVPSKKSYDIISKYAEDNNIDPDKGNPRKYLNVNKGNQPSLIGTDADNTQAILTGGIIGLWTTGGIGNEENGRWVFEDAIDRPVVVIGSNEKITLSHSSNTAVIYYRTDGDKPDISDYGDDKPTKQYDGNPFDIPANCEVIKVVAVVNGIVSSVETYTIDEGQLNLCQSTGCTAYYMVPGYINNNKIPANTTSVAGPKMEWRLKMAGNGIGMQYYYMINESTKDFLRWTDDNKVYVESSSDIAPSDDHYKFYPQKQTDNSYCINPKGSLTKYLLKDGGDISSNNVILSTTSASWNFIPSDVADKKSLFEATTFTPSDANSLHYYFIKNLGEQTAFIVPPTSPSVYASTASDGTDENKSWVIVKAGENDWLTFYYIISAVTGKYMHLRSDPGGTTNTETLDNAIEMTDLPDNLSDEAANYYQFVMARATADNAYYIIPKTHYDNFTNNQYYGLWNNSGIKTILSRSSSANHVKWIFVENPTLFCASPIAKMDNEGNVTLSCPTFGSEIRFTADGKNPDTEGATTNTYNNESWSASTPALIKAVARLKSNTTVVSQDGITILNNPVVTLSQDRYTYNGTAQAPAIGEMEVSITINSAKTTAPSGTYEIDECVNNTDVGSPSSENPPTVTLTDANASDNWYIWNASTTFTIDPLTATLIWTDTSIPYNKTQQKPTATVDNLVTGDECTVTVTVPEGDGITVDEYTATATALSNANYALPAVTTRTFNIVQKDITISGITAENKVYDKTTTATLGYTSVTFDGIVEGDDLTITATGAFEDANAGTGKTVNISGLTLGGTSIANYKLAETGQQATATADITKKDVTVSGITAENKVYDGTATATFVCSTAVVTGLLEGDDLEVTSATGTFNDKNVGEGKTVTITDFTMGGTSGGNYKAADTGNQTSSTANITQREAILAWSNDALTYNATAQAPTATISNAAEGDNITVKVTGAETNKGENYMATASLAGTDAGNYSLSNALSTHNFTIAPKVVGLSWSNLSFTYDGSSHIPTLALTGIIDPDECEVTVTGAQTDASATAYTATASNLTNSNYALPDPATQEFTIGPKSLGTGTNTPAEGITFTIAKENDNYVITVNHEGRETPLTAGSDKDYTISTEGTTSKYYIATINGVNNYTGSISIKYACVNFTTDDSELEWAATFVAENATDPSNPVASDGHALPDGVTAYVITSIVGDNAYSEPLEYIPEGVPVLLVSENPSNGFLVKDASGHTSITPTQESANMLEEVTTDPHQHFTVATIYLLYKNEFVLNKEGDLAKGKVYLNPNPVTGGGSGGGEGARLKIVKGGGTGIENIEYTIDSQSGAWYTLDGRRLSSKPTKKGLYLQSGKKIVVK